MPRVYSFFVSPNLPARLECLNELSMNLRWCWDQSTIELFRRLDRDLWEETGHNPRLMLGRIDQQRLADLESDEAFLAEMDRVRETLREYLKSTSWFMRAHPEASGLVIAYFSAEFGLTECLPNYAGGLGVLAGDYLKSASDLGLPLVGVGLLYQGGYFRQYLNADGWQQETYPINDFHNLPLTLVTGEDGKPLTVSIECSGRLLFAQIWKVQVGRIPLYLLDTNVQENTPENRRATASLYAGDAEQRIQQEMVLGIGGLRALDALAIQPTVCHMNEGHSAFLGPERARILMEKFGLTYSEAVQASRAGNVFTSHTPVAAAFDRFHPHLIERYFRDYARRLGLKLEEFLAYGRFDQSDAGEPFNMAYLAARHSSYLNGVSRLHREVSRKMVRRAWSAYPLHEIPVGYVTNGIHSRSWTSHEMATLLDRYLGPRWAENPDNVWRQIDRIPDEELWRVRQIRRGRLIQYARARLVSQLKQRGGSEADIHIAHGILGWDVLTIGFARRFATYKRATLLLRDPARLKRILTDAKRPVQIVFAGKAHPHDNDGKELIRQIIRFARDPEVRHSLVFLEDFDTAMARYLVQGADVWLNTPRRPNEASGTSGMKVAVNGGLNLSILDGWWDEAHDPEVGWAIGNGEEYSNSEYQDQVESEALYHLLENDVVPLFYDREGADIPRRWLTKMRSSMQKLSPRFSSSRMVAEYTEQFYLPASQRQLRLIADGASRARALAEWRKRLRNYGSEVRVVKVSGDSSGNVRVGAIVKVSAVVRLGSLSPCDIQVQLYHGATDPNGEIVSGQAVNMRMQSTSGAEHVYEGEFHCPQSGAWGCSVRIVPFHEDAILPYEVPWVTWAE